MTSKLGICSAVNTPIVGGTPASWPAHVANALRTSKTDATEQEILRLSKMLTRLQAAAESALAHTSGATGGTLPSFTESLNALSHG
jgi:hypothetical protein